MKLLKCSLRYTLEVKPENGKQTKVLIIQCGYFVSPPSVCNSALFYNVLPSLIVANMVEWCKIT